MDSIHKLLNIVLPLISLFSLFFFLPAILLFKIFSSISRSVFSENVSGKVVLITGASSGIGEHLAYEYAKGGACLVLVARREKQLQEVACKARRLGSPDVIVETGDVSKVEDLNHVVNNAGIAPLCLFEDADNVEDFAPIMNTNFWGSIYCTHLAVPHLRKSRGKIIVIASIAQWSPIPRLSIYSGSKGALVSFYETLRAEVGSDIGITIVGPGFVDSEITRGDFMSKVGADGVPVESTEGCTKAIFKSICRGDRYLFEPAWLRTIYFWNLLCPEARKRALVSFYETLRTEVGSDIGITIVALGAVDSEITRGDFISKVGADGVPVESTEGCTKAIFKSICRGDRREKQLQEVACKARWLGSPDVIVESGDVLKVEDLNHIVNNAGIAPLCLFEDANNVEGFAPIMNISLWGSVYCTHFTVPHLRKSRGKIIVIASIAQWSPLPRLSIYCGSKGALVSFYETLRVEVGSDIGITIAGPGFVDSEMTRGDIMSKVGVDGVPVESTEGCTKAIFKISICRGDSMDSIHKLLNIVLPLISLFSLFIFLPAILLFKISSSILRSVFSENVSGKVVLITGASSGIGEHLAYEYAKGGACLVLVARREKQLQEVACKARRLGSPDVIVETGDVSKVEDCKRFVDAALNHFGRLDHLVNNAGIGPVCMFEDATNVDDFAQIMNINFWGSVYCTHFAIPHLRKSRGKIIVIASIVQWCPIPRVSIYSASKGALVSFYETLRAEVGSDIGITIVAPGAIDSEMTNDESKSKWSQQRGAPQQFSRAFAGETEEIRGSREVKGSGEKEEEGEEEEEEWRERRDSGSDKRPWLPLQIF
ncbi:hypothetical protein RHGRI_024607 [Rhododendron griersonianum]|uniref:Ketoreductase domain-containing protein n=1 Tax=Rhododendron griersonianum TaxID=479676 RepID=A0AAV6JC52_9ERIC|nr:hypothetical protein RHGRI_024607 [Rhododendron griersonianum]